MKERFADFHFTYNGYNNIPSWCDVKVHRIRKANGWGILERP